MTVERAAVERAVGRAAVERAAVEIVIGTTIGKNLLRKAREEGRAQGRAEGLEEVREEFRRADRERLLATLLEDRFGLHPDIRAIARRLAAWPAVSSMQAVITASALDELADAQPPSA